MNDTPLHLAKREWHDFFGNRRVWGGCVAAGLILGLAGPFGTFDVLPVPVRLLYWVGVAGLTFLTGSVVSAWIMGQRMGHPVVATGLAAVASSVVITLELLAINAGFFGFVPDSPSTISLGGYVLLATLIILTARHFLTQELPDETASSTDATPALLARLALEKRGALISVTAVDHYVEVHTSAGSDLVLMRLADAIAETAPEPGLQIHRSHWVALAQVRSIDRDKGKAQVIMCDGRTLPVSRSNWPALKASGLLQRTSHG